MNNEQLHLPEVPFQPTKRSWAFAIDPKRGRRKALRDINRCIITAVSNEAKLLGVRSGMAAREARTLLPELRVLVCNWK